MRILYPYKNALWALRPAKPLGVLSRHPCRNPKPLSRERLCMLCWLCIVQSLWAYTPGIRAGAECGAAALTKQGRLKSVAHSRCTMQRHQRLTTCIGATPKARMLWLLAKSFARCKTNRASNAKTPFSKIYRFFDRLKRASCVGGSQRNYLFFFFLLSTAVIMPTAITTTRATPQTIYIVGSN